MSNDQYGIMDDDGVIYQGDETYIDEIWAQYFAGEITKWNGDLVKFKVLDVFN